MTSMDFQKNFPVCPVQYYHASKIKQYDWLIYSWIINEFDSEQAKPVNKIRIACFCAVFNHGMNPKLLLLVLKLQSNDVCNIFVFGKYIQENTKA
jgi:hypothetical protein